MHIPYIQAGQGMPRRKDQIGQTQAHSGARTHGQACLHLSVDGQHQTVTIISLTYQINLYKMQT